MKTFFVGQRVKLSKEGLDTVPRIPGKQRFGTVVELAQNGHPHVRWGRSKKRSQCYHPDLIDAMRPVYGWLDRDGSVVGR